MPFKMMGKSPLTKALVGKQGQLPENLKAAIKAAPGPSPATMVSPLKETEYAKTLKAARAAGMSQFDYNKKMKADKAASNQGRTEGSGAATANQNAGQTFQDLQKKVAGMSQAQKDKIKKNQNQMSGKKKTGPTAAEKAAAAKKAAEALKAAAAKEADNQAKDSIEPTKAELLAKQKKSAEEKAKLLAAADLKKKQGNVKRGINTDNTYTNEGGSVRTVRKGVKNKDGSVSKTRTTSVAKPGESKFSKTSTRDVEKGAKKKGERRTKTVSRTKYNKDGTVKKIVERTRGDKVKKSTRKVTKNPQEAKKKAEEMQVKRDKRNKLLASAPGKMVKSPAKNYKKGYYK
jgi:hypothetical protein